MNDYLMPISDQEFQLMRELIYKRFGINLTEQKRSLLVSRLQKLIRGSGFAGFRDYYEHLVNDRSEEALGQLVDRVSTNHTFFNREKDHFEYFSNTALPAVVGALEKSGSRDLRIWCAGCSSGEEAYMLLMLLREFFGSDYGRWEAGLLATDISHRALTTARAGIYPDERMDSLPDQLRSRYFRRRAPGSWEVRDELRREATFRRFNLMNQVFPFKKPFHIIFCRNVMIYFDQPTRDGLVARFHRHTAPGGYLFIGHSETLGRNQDLFNYLQPATYQRRAT
ncbi:chemotaxis protein methyltransferase [Desulfuromonas versatilis]|uniref:protein-glutamate O-methyltransferase n=1 Tax=Desulfuromonas versatilis TaxID=2802975 RepID=A0ABN6E2U4_9BACT|nr:protein-glutamate O-methyltransferase CheR [Desulfuromonas versatilis]BCR06646.1 chemotaxis protein methyltransferase [Desulfuromonas versatilis]